MELYDFYVVASIFGTLFGRNGTETQVLIISTIIAVSLWVLMFFVQGIGLYTMAKRRGMKKKALAFIPFANIYYIGKLSGECIVFGQKMKRPGLYAMIAETIASVLCVSVLASQLYLYIYCGAPLIDETFGTPYWVITGGGVASAIARFYEISSYFITIVQLIAKILMLILMSGLYKKYNPRNYFMLGFLTAILPARYLIVFALRNRTPIDYEAYMRARREAYMRQQRQYRGDYGGYGNPYGNPYNRPYGNYEQSPFPETEAHKKPEDPFEEFSEKGEKDASAPQSNENSDGFFD